MAALSLLCVRPWPSRLNVSAALPLPGLSLVPAQQIRELPDDNAVWLWNSQPINGDQVPIGEAVDPKILAEIPLGDPLRLVRIERDLWAKVLEPDLEAPDEIQIPMMALVRMIAIQILPSPQGDLQVSNSVTPVSSRQRISEVTELVPWDKRWPVWRCWRVITTSHFVVM